MTWSVHITQAGYELLAPLSADTRNAVFELFRRLEDNPYAPSTHLGGNMYEAVFSHGIVTIFVNADTRRITPVQITAI